MKKMTRKMRLRSIPKTVTVGVCTGCHFVVVPGPWFKKRIVRHLREIEHNHDACRMLRISRKSVQILLGLLDSVERRDAGALLEARALYRKIMGNAS